MSGIDSYIKKDGSHELPSVKFTRLRKKCKNKEEVRNLEKRLLRPVKLRKHIGPGAHSDSHIEARTIRLVFPDNEWADLFSKHFKTTDYIHKSCYDFQMFLDFLEAIDNGELTYEEETRSFTTS